MNSGIGSFILIGRQLRSLGRRFVCSYQHEASHQLQIAQSSVSAEEPLYNDQQVRKWLAGFPGGAVHLQKDESSGIAQLILENKGIKNALTGKMMIEFAEAVSELENWETCRCVILRGADGQFCTGGDLKFVRDILQPVSGTKMSIFMQSVTSKLYQLPAVSVALVQGQTLGGGAELAVACDFRLMTREAKMSFIQATMGVCPGWGGGTHLTRLVGSQKALRLLTTAKVLDAEECLRMGLVDGILEESGDVVQEAVSWANTEWSKGWVDAVKAAKSVVRNVEDCTYAEALNREQDIFISLWGGKSHKASLERFLDKK